MNKKKVIWSLDDHSDIIDKKFNIIKNEYEINNIEEIIKRLNYKKNENLLYELNSSDSFYCLILSITFLFLNKHFV